MFISVTKTISQSVATVSIRPKCLQQNSKQILLDQSVRLINPKLSAQITSYTSTIFNIGTFNTIMERTRRFNKNDQQIINSYIS